MEEDWLRSAADKKLNQAGPEHLRESGMEHQPSHQSLPKVFLIMLKWRWTVVQLG